MKELLCYVRPWGALPLIANTKKGALLLIGSAISVWGDLKAIDSGFQGDRGAINDMMSYYPGRLEHGFSLHAEKMGFFGFNQWFEGAKKGWPPMTTHSNIRDTAVKHVWDIQRDGGTSGLFAVLAGLLMGYEHIVLAGIPCDGSPRIFDPPDKKHDQFSRETVHQEWLRAGKLVFQGRVKSLSGNTRTWFGEP